MSVEDAVAPKVRTYRLYVQRYEGGENWQWQLQASNGAPMAAGPVLYSSKRNAVVAAERVAEILREGLVKTVVE